MKLPQLGLLPGMGDDGPDGFTVLAFDEEDDAWYGVHATPAVRIPDELAEGVIALVPKGAAEEK